MPVIDPRIIANSMMTQAPQMPDVNAMMQAQTQGYQNMYNTQRQVSADQQAMQAREAEAATQALAPAIASVFSDPSDKGLDAALTMVPPQYQSVAKQQMDRLRQVPDIGNRKNMIRAALMQDERGRALLQQIEASANAQLNAAVAGRRQSLDEQRLAIDAAAAQQAQPTGEFVQVETDRGIFILNKKTGEMRPATGESLPGPRAEAEGPIDVAQPPQVLQPKAKTTEVTQAERRAAALLDNVVRNARAVNNVITKNSDAFKPSAAEAAMGFLPWGQQQLTAWEQNPQRKIVSNRMRQSIDALLTLATGAAYTEKQLNAQIAAYMPGFFDEDSVKRDKIMALRDRIESEKLNAGRAWTPEQESHAQKVFAQFENIVDAMSTGGGVGGGEVDTNNPYLKEGK